MVAGLETLMPLHSVMAVAWPRSCITVDSCWSSLSQALQCVMVVVSGQIQVIGNQVLCSAQRVAAYYYLKGLLLNSYNQTTLNQIKMDIKKYYQLQTSDNYNAVLSQATQDICRAQHQIFTIMRAYRWQLSCQHVCPFIAIISIQH